MLRKLIRKTASGGKTSTDYDSVAAYQWLLKSMLRVHRGDRDLAFAEAIGSRTVALFESQGDDQVAVLRHHGLTDGLSVYDLGCGCGRTAQALQRSGWSGHYMGTDIIDPFVDELKRKCPGFEAAVHREPTIAAMSDSVDLLYHWSVFTHLAPEECYLYLRDSFRALKPGGTLVFSFMELTNPEHWKVFEERVKFFEQSKRPRVLDAFLDRNWIDSWANRLGFTAPIYTEGSDSANHPPTWQTLARLNKPAG